MGQKTTARQFWVKSPGRGEILEKDVSPAGTDHVLVQTLYSGVSHGTEMLVYRGQVPEAEYETMRAPFQEGAFPGPVKYGYAAVGRVMDFASTAESTPLSVGDRVFALHPHQDLFWVPAQALRTIPAEVPARRAVLAANMETAINAVWDGGPDVGDRVVVVGGGVVGLLVAWLVSAIPGVELYLVDVNPGRRAVCDLLGVQFRNEAPSDAEADLVFHASGSPEGLESALACAGKEATVVEVSWFGATKVPLSLGSAFHARRLTIKSSQVGALPPQKAPRWSYGRRMSLALEMLRNSELDALISGETSFSALPALFERLAAGEPGTLCECIRYESLEEGNAGV